MSVENPYGFDWGPLKVERLCHIAGRAGYVISVKTEHAEVHIYVSEKGRVVDAYRPGKGRLVEPS